jgi:SAM-dependent methyltransferase
VVDTNAANPEYDETPYPGLAHVETHPARLHTIARVLGLDPPAPAQARILEIGCGDGTNLIHIAETLPGAQLYGFDAAARHVAAANTVISALALTNVRIERRDIMEFGPNDGQFDYIITHGVYSWVPEHVRARLLAICSENLSPNGVAYVSYNAYPGWHAVDGVRKTMLTYIEGVTDARQRVRKARDLLAFLVRKVPDDGSPYGRTLHAYAAQAAERDDGIWGHDDLSPETHPFYLTEFVRAAEAHGLAYLHEANFAGGTGGGLSSETLAEISTMSDTPLQAEQLADFVTNRSFHRTLLCHPEQAAKRNFDVDAARLNGFFLRGEFHPRIGEGVSNEVRAWNRALLTPKSAVAAAALTIIGEHFPGVVSFEDVVAGALQRVPGRFPDADADTIAATLALTYSMPGELLTLWPYDPGYLSEPPERPLVRPYARYRAARGERSIPDQFHRIIELDPAAFLLLPSLDGTHTRMELYAKLVSLFPDEPGDILAHDLDESLRKLAANALLTR